MSEHYVYSIDDPRTGQPFYIGKGKGRRIHDHFKDCQLRKRSRKNSMIKAIRKAGFEPVVTMIAEGISDVDACALERQLIARYGRLDRGTGILTNATDGGEGTSGHVPSPKQIAWRKTGRIGKSHTPEARKKIAEMARKQWFENNPKAKRCRVGDLEFKCGAAAVRHFGISLHVLKAHHGLTWI